MKKIIMSLGMVVFAGALIAGGTGAFFSDTETSTANVFTAGAIDLKVDSTQHYNGNVCSLIPAAGDTLAHYAWVGNAAFPVAGTACDGTWTQTDLGISNKFFNFADVKPGDEGEDTISLHIDSNPAWACADVAITANSDNTCTEPEQAADAENGACVAEPIATGTNGDLAQNLWFVAWNDNGKDAAGTPIEGAVAGDNIHQAGEVLYFNPGPASNVLAGGTLTLADGSTGSPLPGGSDSFVGLAWCAGTMTASTGTGAPVCNGATMGNNAQTDSMTANITFRVEQARNNAAFRCVRPAV